MYEAQRIELRIHVDLFHMGGGETEPSAQQASSKLACKYNIDTHEINAVCILL